MSAKDVDKARGGTRGGAVSRRGGTVAVVGGGVAGLTAAWELARAGVEVDLYEASNRLGGAVASLKLGGIELDAGAEAFATRSGAVHQLITDLGLGEQVVSPNPIGAWLQLPDLAAPLPATGILGIPGDPQADDVTAILGREAAARAAEDLTMPMTWSADQQPSLGEVVRQRMGEAVVEKLVAPISSGVHSAGPGDLSLAAAHPALLQTMLEEGSLARAVTRLKAAVPAGSAVQSLQGGMNTLVVALQDQLHALGARIHLETAVRSLAELEAEHIVLAVDEQRAAQLAPPWVPVPDSEGRATAAGVALAALLVRAPELDVHPRGTGMLVAPTVERIGAKAMTHISAKWDWAARRLHEQLGQGHHLLRLSYGRVTDDPAAAALGFHSADQQLLHAAEKDLPALTGVPIAAEQILDSAVVRWRRALPAASAAQRERAAQFREALATYRLHHGDQPGPHLWAVGAWIAGTGLAQIIPDAREAAGEILADC